MKTTVLVFHPHLEKESKVKKTLADKARQAGIEVRDLYVLYPDFAIDVAKEQQVLEEADRIILQFPIYWYQTPALMKQWFDAVFEYGWAYGSTGTKLQGKEILLVPSFGAKEEDYQLGGRFDTTVDEILKPITTIQYLTGLKFLAPFIVTDALSLSDSSLREIGVKYKELLNQRIY